MHSSGCLAAVWLLLATVPLACSLRWAAPGADAASRAPAVPRYRVAALTSGTILRFFLKPTAENFIAPLVREGHTVDCYMSLNSEAFSSWKGYAKHFLYDPVFEGHEKNLTFMADLINRTIRGAGGNVRTLQLHEEVRLSFDGTREFLNNATGWNMHPDRPRTLSARSNALKLMLQFELLWAKVLEAEMTDGAYDFVITTRDDAMWVRPFSLNAVLLAPADTHFVNDSIPPLPVHSRPGPPQGFHLRCIEGSGSFYDSQREAGLTEYIFVLRRSSAAPFLTLYSRLLKSPRYWALHNLEQFLLVVAMEQRTPLKPMPAALLPMQRAGRVWLPHIQRSITCLHKACDSATASVPPLRPMDLHSGSPICQGGEQHQSQYWQLPIELFFLMDNLTAGNFMPQ
mmetsp:Transcript_76410/g.224157  ORF Transcript_76410/g.224157 Transcript_76410/m.224157 type:complete len:399 (-) Transcript_76410:132-1328(-)